MRPREGGFSLEREDIGDVSVMRLRGLRYLVDEAEPVFGNPDPGRGPFML